MTNPLSVALPVGNPPQLDMNRQDLIGILAMPNPALYDAACAPTGFTTPTVPGGPPQWASDYARQAQASVSVADLVALAGPWREFFKVRSAVQHL